MLHSNRRPLWAYSLHSCTTVLHDLDKMWERKVGQGNRHKEEIQIRISSDFSDREKIKKRLEQCIHPLDTTNHPKELVNVTSGKINHGQTVNTEQAISLGKIQSKYFCQKLPGGFHESLVAEVHASPLKTPRGSRYSSRSGVTPHGSFTGVRPALLPKLQKERILA